VHDHRDGRAALENFLQAQPHETLSADDRDGERWNYPVDHRVSFAKGLYSGKLPTTI